MQGDELHCAEVKLSRDEVTFCDEVNFCDEDSCAEVTSTRLTSLS